MVAKRSSGSSKKNVMVLAKMDASSSKNKVDGSKRNWAGSLGTIIVIPRSTVVVASVMPVVASGQPVAAFLRPIAEKTSTPTISPSVAAGDAVAGGSNSVAGCSTCGCGLQQKFLHAQPSPGKGGATAMAGCRLAALQKYHPSAPNMKTERSNIKGPPNNVAKKASLAFPECFFY